MDKLERIFEEQHDLQLVMPSGDPALLDGDARADFIRWNAYALEDEIHEATAETGWKPWASSRHINHEQYKNELVDALHFFVNLCLVGGITADELFIGYLAKRNKNERRQLEGYTGVKEKCPGCHRDLDELLPGHYFAEGCCFEPTGESRRQGLE